MSRIGTHRVLVSRPAVVATTTATWYLVAGKTCVAAYQPKGAASLALSYVNLANPGTYDAAPGTAPALTAGGWQFTAASSQYLDTGIVPGNSWSLLVRFSGSSGASRFLFGGRTGTSGDNGWFLATSDASAANRIYSYGNRLNVAGAISAGVMGFGNTATPYLDGVAEGSARSGTTTTTVSSLIGAFNNGGTAANFFDGTIAAVAIYSSNLTAGEVATVSAAMAAL